MHDIDDYNVTIIIPCKNEGIYIKQTLNFLLNTEAKHICKILVIDDNSNDNCCDFLKYSSPLFNNVSLLQTKGIGASQARNLGASLAVNSNILIFCDAHITMEHGWLYELLKVFKNIEIGALCPGIGHFNPDMPVGYGQTWNEKFEVCWLKKPTEIEEIPLVPGGCMAIRKSVFDAVDGFDNGFYSWGYEDVELSLKLWLMGYKCFVHPGVRIGHKFRKVQPYYVDLAEFHYNKLRMAISHFNTIRINKLIQSMHEYLDYNKIIHKIDESDSYVQRANYFKIRLYDDDWFFNKFNIPF
jgi:GT2 family glycosyltransferase